MSDSDTIEQGEYLGATADEMQELTLADRLAGVVSQRAMFRRRGTITLRGSGLVLSDWSDRGDLRLARDEVSAAEVRFDRSYGRLDAGLVKGKPLILHTRSAGDLFLLVDRREFSERTEDEHWRELISGWMAG